MIRRKAIQRGMLVLLTSTLASCAANSNPWVHHDRFVDLKTAAADPARMCDVVVENATDQHLDAVFNIEGEEYGLGLLPPGQRSQFGVSCRMGRIEALASSSLGAIGGSTSRFRKVARLDVLKATYLRFTMADLIS